MCAENITIPFDDAPGIEQVEAIIGGWCRPELPTGLKNLAIASEGVLGLARLVRGRLAKIRSSGYKGQFGIKVISWLYDFIRANVGRGRVFDLGEVLRQGSADCLGYAKLFTLLGRLFGLDAGVTEVVVDNAGRYVPHTIALVRLDQRQWRFVDLWYGSKNIRHKRIGLQVRRGGVWQIEDLELRELGSLEICYLPDHCVDAITLYILGNRHLARQEFDSALEYYSKAIDLYSGSARFYYNRAIAYENLGEYDRANADYAQALRDDAALIRILATEHDDVISLLDLHARGIDNQAQAMYLLYHGFTTGKKVPLPKVAGKFGLPETETREVLSSVEAKLAISSE